MDTILVTGGTGLVGRALTSFLLERGYRVIILTRKPGYSDHPQLSYAQWDPAAGTLEAGVLQQADYIVHLAGAGVSDHRWTAAYKQQILDSRVQGSNFLYEQLKQQPNKVKSVISSSATGYYGETTNADRPFRETDAPANDFLGKVCQAWEKSVMQIQSLGKKVVILRTGIVLSRDGGALKEFYKPLRFGFATILGSGEQYISWIHIQDMVRLYFNAIVNNDLDAGAYNAVAPVPVKHKTLVMAMAHAAKGKSFIPVPVPSFALKIALGEMSVEVLKSVKASSEKIQQTGFQFSYPEIDKAMEQLLSVSK
ncbi:TIGR01777 family oxidoreductase [Chitinophaga horti]|uniref:TIGR01777 family oxidoreductase n=1 Tax=Chitinophaga horti TaxID=2920382 RepID=A0ABY6J0X9_9BACT|nr:TIGR01777 family oxidoreductase [Chitinophaga horti]UYQ93323.1 TIGR01777 family oxidoreductase [Chitinophaga horti]